jgi:two-component system sensor histidine kinase KdpD
VLVERIGRLGAVYLPPKRSRLLQVLRRNTKADAICCLVSLWLSEVFTMGDEKRKTPEELLKIIEREQRGYLKIFIGAAPGVGKTYMMLCEGNELLEKGIDIVIGLVETHGRVETAAQIGSLPVFPLKSVQYKGREFQEMDVDGLLTRRPQYVIVDELAHTNVPDSKNRKRYEDVMELVKAGIHVITAMNI